MRRHHWSTRSGTRPFRVSSISGILGATLLLVTACGSQSSSPSGSQPTFTIGFTVSKTGLNQAYDLPPFQSAEFAIKEINAAGGLLGHKLIEVSADNQSSATQSANAGIQVIDQGAKFVVVSCDYDTGGPAALQAQSKGLLSFSLCAGTIEFGPQGIGNLAFTMGTDASEESSAMAEWGYNTKGWRRAFVIHQVVNAYEDESCSSFEKRWAQLAGPSGVVGIANVKGTDTSFDSVIAQARSAKPDVVYGCIYPQLVPPIQRGLNSVGLTPTILENQGVSGDYWKAALPTISNIYYPDLFSINGDDPSPAINTLVSAWKAQYPSSVPLAVGDMPSGYGLIYVWAAAVKKAGTFDATKVAQVLEGFQDYQTPIGPWSFTTTYHINLQRQMRLMQIQNGKTSFVMLLRPQQLVLG